MQYDKNNPFLMPPRSVISFSGGRTSGLMLHRTIDAHGGKLPDDVVAIFNNTGREREETLQFVRECGERWGVPVVWLEYTAEPSGKYRKRDNKPLWHHTFKIVDFATASRNGEPFDAVIRTRNFLPNPVMRFCTGELKIKTTWRYVRKLLGWDTYTNAIGFRSDEASRVANLIHSEKKKQEAEARVVDQLTIWDDMGEDDEKPGDWKRSGTTGETPVVPLWNAGLSLANVEAFWVDQPFKLDLKPYEGNCDGCFLKGANKLLMTFKDRPDLADWWAAWETKIKTLGLGAAARNASFRADRPKYHQLKMVATGQTLPGHFDFGPEDLSADGRSCSLWDDCACTD